MLLIIVALVLCCFCAFLISKNSALKEQVRYLGSFHIMPVPPNGDVARWVYTSARTEVILDGVMRDGYDLVLVEAGVIKAVLTPDPELVDEMLKTFEDVHGVPVRPFHGEDVEVEDLETETGLEAEPSDVEPVQSEAEAK